MAKKPCRVIYNRDGREHEMTMAEFMTELNNGLLEDFFAEGVIKQSDMPVGYGKAKTPATPTPTPAPTPAVPAMGTPNVPPMGDMGDDGADKKRMASRAKRIKRQESYEQALSDYVKEYTVVSSEVIRQMAQEFFDLVKSDYEDGNSKAFDELFTYVQSLLLQDIEAIRLGNLKEQPPMKSALAVTLAQLAVSYGLETGNGPMLTDWNQVLDVIGRLSGTAVAFLNKETGLDALDNLVRSLMTAQRNAMAKKVSSGRNVGEVVNELQDEVNKLKSEAVDKLEESTAIDNAATTIANKPKAEPKPRARQSDSKKARLRREESEAIDTIKRLFSRASAPGPLMAASPKNAELAKAIVKLARVEIQLGAYTLSEAIAAVYKKTKQYVSKNTIKDILESEWSELSQFSDETKKQDAIDLLVDAIEGRTDNKALKVLGKVIMMVNPDYVKAQAAKHRVTQRKAVELILNNPEQADGLIRQALEKLREEVMLGKHLDMVTMTKPKEMSQEQWDSLRAKYVMRQFENFAKSLLTTARRQQTEDSAATFMSEMDKRDAKVKKAREKYEAAKSKREEKEAEKLEEKRKAQELSEAKKEEKDALDAYNKQLGKAIKAVARKFYKQPTDYGSIAEALIAEMPSLSLADAIQLAEVVEAEMQRISESQEKSQITRLVREMTDGKNDSDAVKVVAKAMWNTGAMNTYGFANLLSEYLGFKKVPANVVNRIITYMKLVAQMPNGYAKTSAMQSINAMVATYTENGLNFLNDVANEVRVRNLLSGEKTIFTGGLSVFLLTLYAIPKSFIIRPVKTSRAIKFAFKNFWEGRNAVRVALKNTFIQHGVPYGRELTEDKITFSSDRAWIRSRKMKWSEVFKVYKSAKARGVSYAISKLLVSGNLQGKHFGIANFVNDLAAFLDYMNVVGLRDFYASIDAQKSILAQGFKSSDPKFTEEWKSLLGMSKDQLDVIEQQVNNEIANMTAAGAPIPSNYKSIRTRELIRERSDLKILNEAHDKAIEAMGMGQPSTLVGSVAYTVVRYIQNFGKSKTNEQISLSGLVLNQLLAPIVLFMRMGIVLGEKSGRYVPIIGPMANLLPFKFTYDEKENKVRLKRDEEGNVINVAVQDPAAYAARVAFSSIVTGVAIAFISYAYDDEELKDENGKPMINPKTGKPYVRRRWAYSDWIDFYGTSSRGIKFEQRGTEPRGIVRYKTSSGEWIDVPFQALPYGLYGIAVTLGQMRDEDRYIESAIKIGKVDDVVMELVELPTIDVINFSANSYANSFNTDFTTISRFLKNAQNDNVEQAVIDMLAVDNAKSLTNPAIARGITRQIQELQDQHEIYIGYKMKDDGMEGLTEHLMKDVWFLDPFIPDRENLESLDPFGNPISFPPMYDNFIGMFGSTTTYKLAEHEQKYKELYDLFKDENGQYDPKRLSYPKRYIVSTAGKGVMGDIIDENITYTKSLRREISDEAYRNFGEMVRTDLNLLNKLSYEEREKVIPKYFEKAKKDALMEKGSLTIDVLIEAAKKKYKDEGKKITDEALQKIKQDAAKAIEDMITGE